MKKILLLLIPLTSFLYCSKDADPEPVQITIDQLDGYVQKGPYIGGTQIQIYPLNSDLSQTGINFNTQIVNDNGFFSIENIQVESEYILFSGIGFYFNEVTGAISSSNLSLQTLSNIENRSSLNINILTHLERKRVEYLHTENGLSFGEAKTQAINEIFDIFCMSDVSSIESENLNILESGENNAKLLAISIILQGNLSVGDLSELLFDISSDIETDGVLNDVPTINYLRDIAAGISNVPGLETIRSNIESRMEFLDITDYTIPDFENYIVNFLECNSGSPEILNYVEVSNITSTSANFYTAALANSAETTLTLEYGLTEDYGFSVEALESPINGVNQIDINFQITDLSTTDIGNEYFFRVKAENSNGVVYSNYDTNSFNTLGLLIDIEGNEYNTVKIGEQYWMSSNLKTTTYNNGLEISNPLDTGSYTGAITNISSFEQNAAFLENDNGQLVPKQGLWQETIGAGALGSYAVIELNFEDGFVTDTNVIDGGHNWVDGSYYILEDPATNLITLNFTGDDVLDDGLWLYYENNPELNEIYGKWYDGNVINRRAVIDGELVNIDSNLEICPEGWRVPLPSDISELGNYLGSEDGNNPGSQWFNVSDNLVVGGDSGFDAYGNGLVVFVAAQFRQDNGFGEQANFWFKGISPSDGDPYGRFHFSTPPNNNQTLGISGGGSPDTGYCIRCIKE